MAMRQEASVDDLLQRYSCLTGKHVSHRCEKKLDQAETTICVHTKRGRLT